jgi:hypothetical protein
VRGGPIDGVRLFAAGEIETVLSKQFLLLQGVSGNVQRPGTSALALGSVGCIRLSLLRLPAASQQALQPGAVKIHHSEASEIAGRTVFT